MSENLQFELPPLPQDEAERLAALEALAILDTMPEAEFDDIVSLAAELCGTPISLVSLVDSNRQWFKARHGLDAEQTGRSMSFCGHAILQPDLFEVQDAQADPRFAGNPLVVGDPHIRFYAGVPLALAGGQRVGTLCVIDSRPRQLSGTQRRQLAKLARIAVRLLESRRERLLAEAKAATLDTLLDRMPSAVVVCNGQGQLSHFNGLARTWHGVDPREMPPEQWAEYFDLFEADGTTHLTVDRIPLMRAFRGEPVEGAEIVIRAKGQPPRHVFCYGRSIVGAQGHSLGALVVMNDVTEMLATRAARERQRRDLEMILEGTHAGTWQWNVQTGETVFNERWAEICGYTLAELQPVSIETWARLAHPDDLEQSNAALQAHFGGELDYYDVVCRMRHKAGHWVWVHDRGRVYERTDDGQPLWMAGTHLDISALKDAEAEVVRSRTHMETIINASSDVAIIATDPDGTITLFNPAAERMLGYTAEALVGRCTPAAFHDGDEVAARSRELTAALGRPVSGFDVFVHAAREGRTETRSWTYVTRAGARRDVRLSVSALLDEAGAISGFLGLAVDQTEQRAAEREARLQAERFRGAFDSVAVGMALVGLDGRWMAVNDALCRELGYEREELLEMTFQQITHPDDLHSDLAQLQDLVEGRSPGYRMVKRYIQRGGQIIWAHLSVALVRDEAGTPLHFVSQIQNITAEREARAALEASEARLRGLFELSPVGIVLSDLETGRFLDVNYALVEQTGYTREELLRLSDRELTADEYRGRDAAAVQQLMESGQFAPYEKLYRREGGELYPVRVQGVLLHDPDKHPVVWSLVEDVSDRHRIEKMKSDFVATVSHELRTPLTSISGALQLLASGVMGQVPEAMGELLGIATTNSQRLVQLVNDLLDMDKLVAGKMEMHIEPVDVDEAIARVASAMRGYADPLEVRLEVTGDRGGRILADESRLTQVLTNLVSNACKHSPAGAAVTLGCEVLPSGDVVIDVIDRGSGIPARFRPMIFEKFVQADQGDARHHSGTGLGLAICKELVARMNGVIGFESEQGRGSHFWVRLPGAVAGQDGDAPGRQRRPRLLHVEDDPDVAMAVCAVLRHHADIERAGSVHEAHQWLRKQAFDAVLLDLRLPDGSGEEVWEALCRAQPGVPVVVLSGHEVPRTMASQVAAVIGKRDPWPDRLLQALAHVLASDVQGERNA